VGAVALALWAVVALRLLQITVLDRAEHVEEAEHQQARSVVVDADRGSLLDSEGRELAVSVPAWSAWADPSALPSASEKRAAAARLAAVLDVPESVLRERLSRDREFVWLERRLSPEQRLAVERARVPGVAFVPESRRFYPQGELLAHALGFTGTDGTGLEGLEHSLDDVVSGRPGRLLCMRDARGQSYLPDGVSLVAPTRGRDVVLTFDAVIQHVAERELEAAVERTQSRAGTVVVMFPRTGEVAALSNRPTYTPSNTPSHPSHLRTNRAVASCYEPGSTLKMFTAAAALTAGMRPTDVIDCGRGSLRIGRTIVHDHESFDRLTVAEVLAKSSNVGAMKLGQRAGIERLHFMLTAFGFGRPTGIDLPGESAGILRDPAQWTPLSLAAISFGQEIGVTPIQLAAAAAAIANGGTWMEPHVVREIRGAHDVVASHQRAPRRVISESVARDLVSMLRGVVEHGTGTAAQVSGYTVAGKTGTAQKIGPDGKYLEDAHVASFVGWIPAENPAFLILVVLDEPQGAYHGGDIAAPVFAATARDVLRYLCVPPDAISREIPPDEIAARSASGGGHA
jgi:cell division protein FtsI (penicillin-binding protein 3)